MLSFCLIYLSPDGLHLMFLALKESYGERLLKSIYISCVVRTYVGEGWCLITAQCSLNSRTQLNYHKICQHLIQSCKIS